MKIDGSKIKKAREDIKMPVVDLARVAEFTENNIRNIESGKVKTMNMHIAKAVAKALHIKIEDLLP